MKKKKTSCCEGLKKKCFACQLQPIRTALPSVAKTDAPLSALRREKSADLMDALLLDELHEDEKRYAKDMGVDG